MHGLLSSRENVIEQNVSDPDTAHKLSGYRSRYLKKSDRHLRSLSFTLSISRQPL